MPIEPKWYESIFYGDHQTPWNKMISFFLFSDFDGAARLERSSSILQIDNSGVSKYVTFQLESPSRDIFKFLCCSNCCSFSWSFWVSNLNIMHGIHHILLLSSKIIIRVFNLLKKWTCAKMLWKWHWILYKKEFWNYLETEMFRSRRQGQDYVCMLISVHLPTGWDSSME